MRQPGYALAHRCAMDNNCFASGLSLRRKLESMNCSSSAGGSFMPSYQYAQEVSGIDHWMILLSEVVTAGSSQALNSVH